LLHCCRPPAHDASGSLRSALGAGTDGKLRVGINVQNFLLVNKERAAGVQRHRGGSGSRARQAARRSRGAGRLRHRRKAGGRGESRCLGRGFLGNEPTRANEIAFSAAYLEIEAGYLVPAGSPIRTIEDVDREGVRVAVNAKSAYDLYLTRNLQRAKLFRAPTVDASYDLFVNEKLDVLAGLKPRS